MQPLFHNKLISTFSSKTGRIVIKAENPLSHVAKAILFQAETPHPNADDKQKLQPYQIRWVMKTQPYSGLNGNQNITLAFEISQNISTHHQPLHQNSQAVYAKIKG